VALQTNRKRKPLTAGDWCKLRHGHPGRDMPVEDLRRLAELIDRGRDALLASWREQVRQLPSARGLDVPALNDHVPPLLDELVAALRSVSEQTIAERLLEGSPPLHGLQRQADGFDLVEVVAEYNILRGCIYDLAERHDLMIQRKAFRILNRCFDEAIGLAVQAFATERMLEIQRRRDEYLAFVAHDLRTPLNTISLAATTLERLLTPYSLEEDVSRMVRMLHRNVHQLVTLVDKVLKETAHVQSESGMNLERREFELWPVVQNLMIDLHPLAEAAGVTLINRVPDELTMWADASLVRRMLQNLIANAIQSSPRGHVVVAAALSSEGVECQVSDDGAGIPADRLETIFQKLETDRADEGGTGLGLPIVKAFAEAHGGIVSVESEVGRGSTFRFTLPNRTPLL
jgi:two-component system phosphate regulon sensor histidine kinase PhoR